MVPIGPILLPFNRSPTCNFLFSFPSAYFRVVFVVLIVSATNRFLSASAFVELASGEPISSQQL